MCGINGILHFEYDREVRPELIKAMSDSLAHRGPDEEGIYTKGSIGLGFRRLSIIDLVTGQQPLFNEDHSIACVCNGEIFNYKELRAELEAKGHTFRTRTDVEVVPHLYEELGADMVNRLVGQFAFAIYDHNKHRLLLARDHVGIAPLFYTVFDNSIIFASEIKAILCYPNIPRKVNLTTLDQILTFPGPLSPNTMFEDIHSVPAGHLVLVENYGVKGNSGSVSFNSCVNDGCIKIKEYWDLKYPKSGDINPNQTEADCIDRIEKALLKAVERRLQADVPVGFYLSGGLDSSLIASFISQIQKEKRHSFSIGFAESNIDERRYQQIMANQVSSLHHETLFDWNNIADHLKQAIYHAETPLKESYDTCSLALSKLVRDNHIKVVLTGEGADELFAGYVGYRFDMERGAGSSSSSFQDVEEMLDREIRERVWGDPDFLYERNFYQFNEIKQAIYAESLTDSFYKFDCTQNPIVNPEKIKGLHPVHKRSYVDFKLRIADHLLADHGDRPAFAHSVEARYPFLDTDLINTVTTLPPELLIQGGMEKYILKQMARKHLPEAITQRTKFAFVAPGSPYLLRQNIEWIEDILSFETIKRQGYFNPATVENLKKMYKADGFTLSQTFENDLLMIILTFGIFLELFNVK
ncbi:MAG: asparagine synthase (glutamine-hydrolyzing) [Desulfamplus sp.]|nr:asparagine synthase (glutamine-hydrolyzing) [Desulfamplus sp.]